MDRALSHFEPVCGFLSFCYFCLFQGGCKGHYILDRVKDHLNLVEREYFGLRYVDCSGQTVSDLYDERERMREREKLTD